MKDVVMANQAVLFDLDGTLTDPKIGITNSVAYALEKLFALRADPDSLVNYIGPPLKDSFKKYHNLCDSEAHDAVQAYRQYFSKTGIYENSIYDGVSELLAQLANGKRKVILATSKPQIYAREILDQFRISTYFYGIEGSNLDGSLSDKTELIGYILHKYRLDAAVAVMVGDREYDIIGAKNNKLRSIGVTYGYGTDYELASAGADYLADSVTDLGKLLEREFA